MSPNPLIVRVEDGEFLWSSAGGRVLLTTTTPKLVLNRAFVAGETPEFEVNGVKADAGVVTGTGTDGKFTLDLGKVVIRPIPLAFEFRLLVKAAAVTLVDQKLTLIPPLTGATDHQSR